MPLRHQARPLRFIRLDTGCIVCISHLPNKDGYFRKKWGNQRSGDQVHEMFHRYIFRAHHGEIPDGHEVDHICQVRPCCNPEHLRALPGSEHAALTNRQRAGRKKA